MNPEPTRETPEAQPGTAHQPDGTDSSAEWNAEIADENMIPDEDPTANLRETRPARRPAPAG